MVTEWLIVSTNWIDVTLVSKDILESGGEDGELEMQETHEMKMIKVIEFWNSL